MFLVVKELADRFIESVLSVVKGDTKEEKLESALKSCGLMIGTLGSILIWVSVSYYNVLVLAKDMEVGLKKVNQLFDDGSDNSISVFVSINDKLSVELEQVKKENMLLLTGASQVVEENKWLRQKLDRTSDNIKVVKAEYRDLLGQCVPTVIKNSRDN